MARFACTAYKNGFINTQQFASAISEQWKQERHNPHGFAERIGEILIDQGAITDDQLTTVLNDLIMEPNISWGRDTAFAKSLSINKIAKQIIGNYVGQELVNYKNDTIFLAGASTIYYAFLGLIKHKADVTIRTINAAILAAYPSVESSLSDVISSWGGSVDVHNGIIKPPDNLLDPTLITQHAGFDIGGISYILISVTGFNCFTGPFVNNETARVVARQALMSQTPVWILIDHTKIQTSKSQQNLLFPVDQWKDIRNGGNIKLIVNCHPKMPSDQAKISIGTRSIITIKKIMRNNGRSAEDIESVVQYQEGVMNLREIIEELPYIIE